jgi:hypothetical protein
MNDLTRINPADKLPDNAQYTNRFHVASETSNRQYVIAQHKVGRYWTCGCPGWITRRKCRHLETLRLPSNMKPFEVGGAK